MQAIGTQVIIAISPIILIFLLTTYFLYPKVKQFIGNIWGPQEVREQPVQPNPRFRDGECSICLQAKRYEVSATCGHSWCGNCILQIYARWNDRIQCPLCRKTITTILRVFDERYGQQRQRSRIINQIQNYNMRFDDNRPFLRRIRQLPTVLRRLRTIILSPAFLILFIRSIYFLRFVFFFITYLLMPFDILPQYMFGAIGYIDDIFVPIFVLLLIIGGFAIMYIRGRQ